MAPVMESECFEAFDRRVHQAVAHLKELMADGDYGCNVLVAATTGLDVPSMFHRGYLMAVGTEETLVVCLANMLKTDKALCAVVSQAVAKATGCECKSKGGDDTDTGRTPAGGDKTSGVLQP